ncbi:MAG: hypothetical protein ACTH31_14155 [Pseudoclavibacter sp.]
MRSIRVLSVALIAVLGLSGCSVLTTVVDSLSESSDDSPTPTPTSSELGAVESISDLRAAYVAAGNPCLWDGSMYVLNSEESGTCSGDATLAVYESDADLQASIDNYTTASRQQAWDLMLLVGTNWTIQSAHASDLQTKFGGEYLEQLSSTSNELGEVATMAELREAYVEAGFTCTWSETEDSMFASESGSCSADTVLSVFDSTSDIDAMLAAHEEIVELVGDDMKYVVGPNWVIHTPRAVEVQAELGGEVHVIEAR